MVYQLVDYGLGGGLSKQIATAWNVIGCAIPPFSVTIHPFPVAVGSERNILFIFAKLLSTNTPPLIAKSFSSTQVAVAVAPAALVDVDVVLLTR